MTSTPGLEVSLGASPHSQPAVRERAWTRLASIKPYLCPLLLAIVLPMLCVADSLITTRFQQHLIGLGMFGVLFVMSRFVSARERRLVWLAVGCWTLVELFASVGWGLYIYRLSGVPLFVPPGHGAVYLFALQASRTPLLQRHGQTIGKIVVGGAGLWAIAGLAVFPHWTGTIDLAGAALWPVLAFCILRLRTGPFYAAIFCVTSLLELTGTALGTWAWVPAQPFTSLPSGNPPSVIAAAYCVVDLLLRLAAGHEREENA